MTSSGINEIVNAETAGSVAAQDYRKAEVFKKLAHRLLLRWK